MWLSSPAIKCANNTSFPAVCLRCLQGEVFGAGACVGTTQKPATAPRVPLGSSCRYRHRCCGLGQGGLRSRAQQGGCRPSPGEVEPGRQPCTRSSGSSPPRGLFAVGLQPTAWRRSVKFGVAPIKTKIEARVPPVSWTGLVRTQFCRTAAARPCPLHRGRSQE